MKIIVLGNYGPYPPAGGVVPGISLNTMVVLFCLIAATAF